MLLYLIQLVAAAVGSVAVAAAVAAAVARDCARDGLVVFMIGCGIYSILIE